MIERERDERGAYRVFAKNATELVSDIGSKAFALQHHSDAEIREAVTFLREVNGPMFDWLVNILSVERPKDSDRGTENVSVSTPTQAWQAIASAPKEGMFLVTDGKRYMVASGNILWASKNPNVPFHLSGNHWTFWVPLPPAPKTIK